MARLMLMKMQQAGAAGLFPILRKLTDYDSHDIYLPFISWHNRFMYDKEKTDRYNEMPGAGVGVSRHHSNGNWSALYGMVFKDSHNEWQPVTGYAWEKGWHPGQQKISGWD